MVVSLKVRSCMVLILKLSQIVLKSKPLISNSMIISNHIVIIRQPSVRFLSSKIVFTSIWMTRRQHWLLMLLDDWLLMLHMKVCIFDIGRFLLLSPPSLLIDPLELNRIVINLRWLVSIWIDRLWLISPFATLLFLSTLFLTLFLLLSLVFIFFEVSRVINVVLFVRIVSWIMSWDVTVSVKLMSTTMLVQVVSSLAHLGDFWVLFDNFFNLLSSFRILFQFLNKLLSGTFLVLMSSTTVFENQFLRLNLTDRHSINHLTVMVVFSILIIVVTVMVLMMFVMMLQLLFIMMVIVMTMVMFDMTSLVFPMLEVFLSFFKGHLFIMNPFLLFHLGKMLGITQLPLVVLGGLLCLVPF